MTIDQLATLASLVMNLVTLAGVIYAIVTAKANSNASKLEAFANALASIERRVERVEAEIEHLPSKDMVHEISNRMSGIQEGFKGFQGGLNALSMRFDRIETYMMGREK